MRTPATVPAVPTDNQLTDADQRRLDRLAEKETILRFDEASPTLHVYTSHGRIASSLQRKGAKPLRVDYRGQKTPASWTFEVPRRWFKVPSPPPKLSEAQREARVKSGKRLGLTRGERQGITLATGSPTVKGITP